jgi:hypothetical protein
MYEVDEVMRHVISLLSTMEDATQYVDKAFEKLEFEKTEHMLLEVLEAFNSVKYATDLLKSDIPSLNTVAFETLELKCYEKLYFTISKLSSKDYVSNRRLLSEYVTLFDQWRRFIIQALGTVYIN